MGATLAEKIWTNHVVKRGESGAPDLLFIDLQFVHEVTSPQAFERLRLAGCPTHHPNLAVATEDHNMPTLDVDLPIADLTSRAQIEALRHGCEEFGVPIYSLGSADQGIVHVVGPQPRLTQPDMTIMCDDSHTSTHGAFGSLALGVGTPGVEHVLAMQTLPLTPFKTMAINVGGRLKPNTAAKDVVLAIIAKVGTNGAQGHVIEYRGEAIRSLSMEARMTICNMSIEAGTRVEMVAPDEATFAYIRGRPNAPENWDEAVTYWHTLATDDNAEFNTVVELSADELESFIIWGTNPGQGIGISGKVPELTDIVDETQRKAAGGAVEYMGLTPGTPIREIDIGAVFIGSCTSGRIEDLRMAIKVIEGRQEAPKTRMTVVPGSVRVRFQTEAGGLDKVFLGFGVEWRNVGCSTCLGMNPDQLSPGERCVSTSNRNLQGRQGPGGRAHLVSPSVMATTAIKGKLATPSDLS